MSGKFISRRSAVGAGMAFLAAGGSANSQNWPARPITIVVGFGAGGITDVATRLLAERLQQSLSTPIVIDNRSGATGMIAAGVVARAQPDGYTLFGMTGSLTIVPSVLQDVSIDVLRDLKPISIYATSPSLLVVGADFPARDIKGFLDIVRARKPGEIAYASSGIGTTVHLMAGMIERAANIQMLHVPYRSSADSIMAVISGQVPIVFSAVNSALPYIKSGSVRALAVATEKRTTFLSDVPTFDEAGLPGIRSDTWFGLAGPAKLPRPMVDRLSSLCRESVKEPAVQAKLASLGAEPLDLDSDAAQAKMQREVASFAELAAAMGIKRE